MTSKQTDTVAMTEQQLDGVSGGPHIGNFWFTAPIQQRRSNRTRYTGDDADALLPALGATGNDHKEW